MAQDFFQGVYTRPWERLLDLCDATNSYFRRQFRITTPLVASSTLEPTVKSQLILELCRRVGATVYLSGTMGRNYLDLSEFAAAGIEVVYHDYRYPEYQQLGDRFESNLSALDLLMNRGGAAADHFASARKAKAA